MQWYGTFYRQYDPQLGRFHQSDPVADLYHSLTPYQYAANNALMYNDPLGDRLPDLKPRAISDDLPGGGNGSGGGGFRNVFFGNPFTNGFMGGNGNAYGYYGGGSMGSNFMAGRTNSFTAMSNERWDNHYGSGKAINESLAQTFGVFYYGSTAHQYVKYSPNGNVSMFTGTELSGKQNAKGQDITYLNYSPFHFQLEGEFSFGVQAEVDISKVIAAKLNLVSTPLFGFKYGTENSIDYPGKLKDGLTINQGAGMSIANYGVEVNREFTGQFPGYKNSESSIIQSIPLLGIPTPFSFFNEIHLGPDGGIKNIDSGISFDISAALIFGGSISGKFYIGK